MPLTNPKLWTIPLGDRADVSDLPNDPQTGANIGKASFSQLFGQINQLPLNAGGVPPSRDDFNALFKILGDNIYYLQNGGVYQWANSQTYNKYAIVMHNGVLYQSQVDGNKNQQPSSTSEQWKPLIRVQTVNGQQADANGNITIDIPSVGDFASLSKTNNFAGVQNFNNTINTNKALNAKDVLTVTKRFTANADSVLVGNVSCSNSVTVTKNLTVKGGTTLANTIFSASPTAPTPPTADNSTKLATTAFVQGLIKSEVAKFGTVRKIATRNTQGVWSITNAVINKPLFIILKMSAKPTDDNTHAKIDGLSGTTTDFTYQTGSFFYLGWFRFSVSSSRYDMSTPNVCVLIPNQTTVSISVATINQAILEAYQ